MVGIAAREADPSPKGKARQLVVDGGYEAHVAVLGKHVHHLVLVPRPEQVGVVQEHLWRGSAGPSATGEVPRRLTLAGGVPNEAMFRCTRS